MQIECGLCGKESIGRLGKLMDKGWVIIFLEKSMKIVRCPDCKPILWERKNNFEEFRIKDIEEETLRKVNKIRMIRNLNKS